MNNLEIFPTTGTASSDGIFLPLTDLVGMVAGDLSETGVLLEGKLTYAFLNSLFDTIALLTPLALPSPEKGDPVGTGTEKYTESITLRIQRFLDLRTNTTYLPTLPNTGSYAGQGGLTIADIWPGAAKVAAAGETGEAGVLIPDSWVSGYGGAIPSTVDSDSRSWVAAFINAVDHTIAVRSTTVASSITRKTDPNTIRPLGVAIPADFYDATNPTSGIAAADLPYLRLVQESITIDYELLTDSDAQTFEVNVATA